MLIIKQFLYLFSLIIFAKLVNSKLYDNFKRYEPNWDSIDKRPLPTWFDESKIGIFLHWGLFSVPSFSSEWFWWQWQGAKQENLIEFMSNNYRPSFTYGDFANQFTAELYDPKQWAEIFKASGAKYIVLTSKHHEGFTLWPSNVSWNWNAMDVGPKRDLLGDLANSVREMNLTFGVYHSMFEWFNPLYLQDKNNLWITQDFVNRKTLPELRELVNIYKPDVIWSDGEWEAPDTYWNSTDFLAWLYNDSPVKDTIVVNDRWGMDTRCKHGGYYSCNDRYNPGVLQPHKWENAMTIDRDSWGYRREAILTDYLTINELLTTLAETVSCGGNLLINIGPTHDGRIIPIFEERLRQLGYWLSINGDSIYKSKPWKHQNDTITKNIWYTQNMDAVYSIVLEWPQQNQVILGAIKADLVNTIQLVGVKGNLYFTRTTGGSTLVLFPQLNPDTELQWAYVLRITFK